MYLHDNHCSTKEELSFQNVTSILFHLCSACGSISFAMVMAWNESLYTDKTYIRNYETDLQKWLVSSLTVPS